MSPQPMPGSETSPPAFPSTLSSRTSSFRATERSPYPSKSADSRWTVILSGYDRALSTSPVGDSGVLPCKDATLHAGERRERGDEELETGVLPRRLRFREQRLQGSGRLALAKTDTCRGAGLLRGHPSAPATPDSAPSPNGLPSSEDAAPPEMRTGWVVTV